MIYNQFYALLAFLINLLTSLIGLLLLARLLLKFLIIDTKNQIITWVYLLSDLLLYPLDVIYFYFNIQAKLMLDLKITLAIIFYLFISWFLFKIISIFNRPIFKSTKI